MDLEGLKFAGKFSAMAEVAAGGDDGVWPEPVVVEWGREMEGRRRETIVCVSVCEK